MSAGDTARRVVNSLPVVGGVTKALFGDPDEEAHTKQLKKMAEAYRQYRPQQAEARMTGLGNQLSLYGPIQALMQRMYGPEATFDTSQLMHNPFGNSLGSPPAPPPAPPAAQPQAMPSLPPMPAAGMGTGSLPGQLHRGPNG